MSDVNQGTGSHEDHSARLKEILSRGLCHGQGTGGNQVCVEQAIAIACGCAVEEQDESITDAPSCVAPAVRRYAIVLNDAAWSSPQKRAAGLTAFALAQLGTQLLDEQEFARRVAIRTVKQVLPRTLRTLAGVPKIIELGAAIVEGLEAAAKVCEGSTDLSAAESAASAASAAKSAAWSAAKSAAKSAASAAESAASAAESAAWSAASAAESARDEALVFAAQMVTEVLDEMRAETQSPAA